MSTLQDELEDLLEDLESAKQVIDEQPPPLPPIGAEKVMGHLNDAESHIDVILDPSQSPSLDPPGIGSADTANYPSSDTLASYVDDCISLANDATNALGSGPDYEEIGDALRTIKTVLLPLCYEELG
jgi:hypothetical protein